LTRPHYAIVVSHAAQRQLDQLYDVIAADASPKIAEAYCSALLDRLESLRDTPYQGTRRDDVLEGLRTFGFRRRVTIAFVVEAAEVSVLGFFYAGQDIHSLLAGSS
jgi:toxin ParE1/3/4